MAKAKAEKKPNGRPDTFSQAKADAIIERVSGHESLRAICDAVGVPAGTFLGWVADRPELAEHYARAKRMQAEAMAAELLAIADDSSNDTILTKDGNEVANAEWIARSRLRVDTRKWILSKMLPKVYGDKIAIGGADDLPAVKVDANVVIDPSEAYKRMLGNG